MQGKQGAQGKGRAPSQRECLAILKSYALPENAIQHMLLVNRIAMFLGRELSDKGIALDLEAIRAASLLHDLDKMQTLKMGNHGLESAKVLSKLGYPSLGRIISKHTPASVGELNTWEEKIVNYADKRAGDTGVVSLEERFAYFKRKYGIKEDDAQKEIERRYHMLEQEIFTLIGIRPEELAKRLGEDGKRLL